MKTRNRKPSRDAVELALALAPCPRDCGDTGCEAARAVLLRAGYKCAGENAGRYAWVKP